MSSKRFARTKKRTIRVGILAANLALIGFVFTVVAASPDTNPTALLSSTSRNNTSVANPLDQVSSADIAVHIARMTNLDETVSVVNHADSINAQLAVAPVDDAVAPKPQIVASSIKSKQDIEVYVAQDGDTLSSIAQKFGVKSESIRWSNGMTGDAVATGTELKIPPVDGIVYTVKDGETIDGLAERFSADKQKLIQINDAEIVGLVSGEDIIIPDGVQPVRRPAYSAASYGFRALAYGPGNGYDYGWCTWHAANRRREIGRPLPTNLGNAITWYSLAQRGGVPTGTVPQAGAALWHANIGGLGHVAFVESVNPDGSFLVSDMNYPTWGVVTYRTVPASDLSNYRFIY